MRKKIFVIQQLEKCTPRVSTGNEPDLNMRNNEKGHLTPLQPSTKKSVGTLSIVEVGREGERTINPATE